MWVSRYLNASGVDLRRTLLMLATSLLVAFFAVAGPLAGQVFAAPAIWDGDELTYTGNVYTPAPAEAPDQSGKVAYQWINTNTDPDTAQLIYFDENEWLLFENQPERETSAELITYQYRPPNQYTNASPPQTIEVEVNLLGEEVDNERGGTTCSGSITGGIGWILCPVSNWLAEVVDGLFEIIKTYLKVAPFRESNDGIYQLWGVMRTIANVLFVVAFMVIIYSQLTSIGISNYGIKTMLPRLIAGAILVNVSFWISALAVDISNLLGANINALFINIRENFVTGGDAEFGTLTWTTFVNYLLAGGATGAALAGFTVAAAGSFTSLFFLALASLISVAFSVLVAFVILAARQAIIVILVFLSPLAFAAFVLPSTKKLFDRWQNSFTTLLLFFPLFGLLFGGSQLAGAAVMNSTVNDPEGAKLHVLLMGLAIQIVPLVLTPLLIRFSTGLLGNIANLTNNSKRGLTDRAKNWAHDRADYHKDRALGQRRAINPFKLTARGLDRRRQDREQRRSAYQTSAKNRSRGYYDAEGNWQSRKSWERADMFKRETDKMAGINDERDKNRYTELEAGRYTYSSAPISRATSKMVSRVTGGRYTQPTYEERSLLNAQFLAEQSATTVLSGTEASREASERVNKAILASQELQRQATGIGSHDIMLAGLVTKDREDYAKKVNAQDQLQRHFALDSSQYQDLAAAKKDVTVTKGDLTYTFKLSDDYTREAAIEHQLAAGSAGEKRAIINESGREVLVRNEDGSYTSRPGRNYEFRTTIQDAVIKNRVSSAVPYINDKSYNQIIKGEWKGEVSENANAIREILEGRLKAENLASANDKALEVLYELDGLRSSSNPSDVERFEFYKSHALDIIRDTSSPDDYRRISDNFDRIFSENFHDMRVEAHKILSDADLSSRSPKSSRAVLQKYRLEA